MTAQGLKQHFSLSGRVAAWLKPFFLISVLALASCTTTNPATGKREFTPFMSPSQEKAVGQESHPQVVRENGGVYDDPELAGYVAGIGGRLVANSELSDMEFTFTLLNTSLVNAFALPGGYVYITRGILAQFNSEAELASVLGHEIGHVTARHSAKRYNQQMFAGLLGAGIGIATQNAQLADAVNYGSQLYLLSYSRDQEYQSDKLGVRYMTRVGYDPYASADMLHMLGAQSQLAALLANQEGVEPQPEFFSTHPNSENRVVKANGWAEATNVQPGALPRHRDRFLAAIDGMLYGDDPSQGFVRGRTFSHPELKFTFTVPENFRMMNSSQALVAQGPGGTVVLFAGGQTIASDSTAAYLQKVWTEFAGDKALEDVQQTTVNGMEAYTGQVTATSNGKQVVARAFAIRYSPTQAYHFLIVMPAEQAAALTDGLRTMTYSFKKLSDAEAAKLKPLRISVVTIKRGDTLTSLASRMDYDDFQLERFLALNGLSENAVLKAGDKVKIVVAR